MPQVDVVPNSTSISAPGWAYVADNGYDPSKAAIQPSGARKRAARASGVAGGNATTRQQNAIAKHIAELDRDNYRDVQIAVPNKSRESASKAEGSKSKTTPNVRRILMSQKTFANHLADEEAALATQNQSAAAVSTPRGSVFKPAGTPSTPRGSVSRATGTPSIAKRSSTVNAQPMPPANVNPVGFEPSSIAPGPPPPPAKDPGADDPLLKSYIPSPPSEAVMEALLSASPLSYNAARSAPPTGKPQRHFCEICGYWGLIKCMKCGARYCSLVCKGPHDEDRCLKFYA